MSTPPNGSASAPRWTTADLDLVPPSMTPLFEQCARLEGWATLDKMRVLASIIFKLRPRCVVESGVFGGRSLIPLALACRAIGHGHVTGFDPWSAACALQGEHRPEDADWWSRSVDYEAIYKGFVRAVLDFDLTAWCSWHRLPSRTGAAWHPPRSVDVFHQDSNHSELVSCQEVRLWCAKVRPGGIWVFDDSDWPTQRKALAALAERDYDLLHDAGTFQVFERRPSRPAVRAHAPVTAQPEVAP